MILTMRYTPSALIQNLYDIALPYRFWNKHSAISLTPLLDHAPTACYKDPRRIFLHIRANTERGIS